MSSRFNLNGSQLRIVTRWDNTYAYDVNVTRIFNGHNSSLKATGGYAIDILFHLSSLLNFSYVFVEEVTTYGFENATTHNVDIFVASYGVFESRAKIVDLSFIIGRSRVVAIINHEFEDKDRSTSFLNPFPLNLWIFLIFFIILCIIFMCLTGGAEGISAQDLSMDTFATFLLKNTQIQYKSIKSYLSKWLISITAVVVLTSYSGQLVSLLTVQIYGIKDLDDLLNSKLKIMLERGYNNDSPIQVIAEALSSNFILMKRLLEKARVSGFIYESFEKSVRDIANDPSSTYIIDEETGVLAVTQALGFFPCTWSAMSVAGIRYPWSMFMRKSFPFKHEINLGLLRLDQFGLLYRLRQHWIPSTPKNTLYGSLCKRAHSDSNSFVENGVQVTNIKEAFLFLVAIGFALSFVCLLIEIWLYKHCFIRVQYGTNNC